MKKAKAERTAEGGVKVRNRFPKLEVIDEPEETKSASMEPQADHEEKKEHGKRWKAERSPTHQCSQSGDGDLDSESVTNEFIDCNLASDVRTSAQLSPCSRNGR